MNRLSNVLYISIKFLKINGDIAIETVIISFVKLKSGKIPYFSVNFEIIKMANHILEIPRLGELNWPKRNSTINRIYGKRLCESAVT